jgi:phosphopantothenoylcysteine decarboxylase/phosphopantothenate--cysteine ligase
VTITLGVTGGIAAYKACEIVRGLRRRGCRVSVVLTRAAGEFITPVTLQALTGRKVITSLFDTSEADTQHIALARETDLLLVAPATANILGKLAGGIADDFLTTFALAVRCPLLIAPAMNPGMWENRAVQENVRRLKERGHEFIGPEEGEMAEDEWGVGRLAAPESIVDRAMEILGFRGSLAGRRVLVTAGPTREAIDAVRFLSNPSTGKMGFAVAEAAVRRGAEVTLVSGPSSIPDPEGVEVVRVTTAAEMRDAVLRAFPSSNVIVKTAAVSDFAPAEAAGEKVRKEQASRSIRLVPTPDILKEIAPGKGDRLLVGFAAETGDLLCNAQRKLMEKGLDLIVANDVSGGAVFGEDHSEVLILDRAGREEHVGPASKSDIAERLLDLIEERLAA